MPNLGNLPRRSKTEANPAPRKLANGIPSQRKGHAVKLRPIRILLPNVEERAAERDEFVTINNVLT